MYNVALYKQYLSQVKPWYNWNSTIGVKLQSINQSIVRAQSSVILG